MENWQPIINSYLYSSADYTLHSFGTGLIHKTFVVEKNKEKVFILQQVNHRVFPWPENISHNIQLLSSWLKGNNVKTLLPAPLKTINGNDYVIIDGEYFRLIPFVENSHSIDTCSIPEEAFEAANQFGNFTASFDGMNVSNLKTTIKDFHNLTFRWNQFREALVVGNKDRIARCKNEIHLLEDDYPIVALFEKIVTSNSFSLRVTHHDTKISNVLFNKENKGICVIDLDTVMPGYFISDLGDMFRTYLSKANEEETDLQLVNARKDFYQAITEGYKEKMADKMSIDELNLLNYAGEFMIYMQALRFLTDYINNDCYYSISYEDNNYQRTLNQLALLKSFRSIIA
ncbi:MAG: hypothetical protein RLY11_1360 [Bacteroidota bacterium]